MKSKILALICCVFVFAFDVSAQAEGAREKEEATTMKEEATMTDIFGTFSCEDIKTRLENFHVILTEEPKLRGVIILYEGKQAKYIYNREGKSAIRYIPPSFGESAFLTQEMQEILIFKKLPIENFLFIDGGFRENFEVEFWIVPNGAKMPKPTPTLETIKYRKGVPLKIECGGS